MEFNQTWGVILVSPFIVRVTLGGSITSAALILTGESVTKCNTTSLQVCRTGLTFICLFININMCLYTTLIHFITSNLIEILFRGKERVQRCQEPDPYWGSIRAIAIVTNNNNNITKIQGKKTSENFLISQRLRTESTQRQDATSAHATQSAARSQSLC